MVIDFPGVTEPMERRVKGIHACLDYLYAEAMQARLSMVAHLIGAAREASRDELARYTAINDR
jgi:hypothetical protein